MLHELKKSMTCIILPPSHLKCLISFGHGDYGESVKREKVIGPQGKFFPIKEMGHFKWMEGVLSN